DGTPHFVLHSLTGWVVGLMLLLGASYFGRPWSRWDGLLPLGLALWAMMPDFIYIAGPAHKDWMDVFLFHVSLDEILPAGVAVLAALGMVLLLGYARFRAGQAATDKLARGYQQQALGSLLTLSAIALLVLVGF